MNEGKRTTASVREWTMDPPLALDEPVTLPDRPMQEVVDAARLADGLEICVVGMGPAGRVNLMRSMANVHPDPSHGFAVSPNDRALIASTLLARSWDVTLILHSHPTSDAEPSMIDVQQHMWPSALMVILSLASPHPVLRAFRIVRSEAVEAAISLQSSGVNRDLG